MIAPSWTDQYFGSPAQPFKFLPLNSRTKPSSPGFTVTAAEASGCGTVEAVNLPFNGSSGPPYSATRCVGALSHGFQRIGVTRIVGQIDQLVGIVLQVVKELGVAVIKVATRT